MPQDDGSKEEEDSFSRQALPRSSTRSSTRMSVTSFAGSMKASGSSFFEKTAAAARNSTKVASKGTGLLGKLRNLTTSKSSKHSLANVPAGRDDEDESSGSEEESEGDEEEQEEAVEPGDEDLFKDELIASFFDDFDDVDGGNVRPSRMTKQPSANRFPEEAPMARKASLTRTVSIDPSIAAELEKLRQDNAGLMAENERLKQVIKTTQASYESAQANYESATAQAEEAKAKAEATTLGASAHSAQAAVPEGEQTQTEQPSAGSPAKGKPGKGKPPPPGAGKGKAATPTDAAATTDTPADIPTIPPTSKGKAGPPALPSKGGGGDAAKGGKGPGPPPGKGPPAPGGKGPPPAGGKGPGAPAGKKGAPGADGGGKGKAGTKGGAAKGGTTKAAGPAIAGKKWHWKTLKHQESAGTVFDSLLVCDKETIGKHWRVDVAMLKALFIEVAVKKDADGAKKGSKAIELTIFDAKRTQNLAIGVVGLRNNCHTEMPDLVAALQALDFASASLSNMDVIELVLTLLPSAEESKELKKIPEEDKERLRSLEKEIMLLTGVPRLEHRLRLAFFAGKAKDIEADVMERLETLEKAARSACESKDLECLLSVSLGIGCYINQSFLADGLTGASEGFFSYAPVGGFKLESLVRMKETTAAKQHVGGLTLVHAVLLHLARFLKDADRYVQEEDVEADPGSPTAGGSPTAAAATSPTSVRSDSRRSSTRSSSSVRRQLTPGLYALKRWHVQLTEDLSSVADASKTVLVEVEDEVRELASEARFVAQEAEANQSSYEGPAEASLATLNETAKALVTRVNSKVEATKQRCEDLCAYFGEKVKPQPGALSDTTQVIFSALAEALGGPITKGVEELCNEKKALVGLPLPEMLNFELVKDVDKPPTAAT